jgi:hypothetical protein
MVLNWMVINKPSLIIKFLKSRIARASERRAGASSDWSYNIVPHHQNELQLHRLKETTGWQELRKFVLDQIAVEQFTRGNLIDLFWATSVMDEESLDLLRPWIHSGDSSKFDIAVDLLASAPGQLAFSHQNQILETLAEALGADSLS